MIKDVHKKVNENQRAVKEKMERVLAQAMADALPTLAK